VCFRWVQSLVNVTLKRMCNGRVRRRIWGGYQGRVEADSPTPETTKPSYFYEGFVLYGAAPDERYVSGRLGFSGVWSSVEIFTYPN